MSYVRLAEYNNAWYHPGRSASWQAAWFFVGLPILRNSLLPGSSLRVRLLRFFGARVDTGVVIKPGVRIKYPWNLRVGSNCWLGEDCWIDNLTHVTLEENVCISQGAYLCTGNHNWSDPRFGLITSPILLKNGSWVGAKAVIAPGVVLGEGAVAGAGSVVNQSIPDFEIHTGNPAQFRRRRQLGATGEYLDSYSNQTMGSAAV